LAKRSRPLLWSFAEQKMPLLRDLAIRSTFIDIYRKKGWGGDGSVSGPGSNPRETAVIRAELPRLIRDFGIASVLDIPCGDFFWMRLVDLGPVRYVGGDILDVLIEANREKFSAPGRDFRLLDVTKDKLPRVDLILCRDCLVHLSNRLVWKALANMKRSGSRYLLATTFVDREQNADTLTGGWRPLNLSAPPFCLAPPLRVIHEDYPFKEFRDKSIGLWELEKIRR
jgi:SAM-dependent methyltransferase